MLSKAAEARHLHVVTAWDEHEWDMKDKLADSKHWGSSAFVFAKTSKAFVKACALTQAPSCLTLVPRHGKQDGKFIMTDDTSKSIKSIQLIAAALLACPRVHLHACWLGLTLHEVVVALSADSTFMARLRSRGTRLITLTGFNGTIAAHPLRRDRHDTYVAHGALVAASPKHAQCCHAGGHVRVVQAAVGAALTVTRDQVLGGVSTYTLRHGVVG